MKIIFFDIISSQLLFHRFYRAAERALLFQRKSDNYGKLFSLIPLLTKIFPNKSDYKQAREASLQIHSYFKVILEKLKLHSI